jgi:hypothetical protein
MDNFNLKSILLGVGIGIIITSTVSIIYLAGRDPLNELSEQEVAKLADKYNLVKNTQLINSEPQNETTTGIFQVEQQDSK